MRIPEEIVNQIIQQSDIIEIIGDYVQLKQRGRNFIGLCPFHGEKTPSFNVSPDKQIYKCFGCGKAGNVVSFLNDFNGFSFIETIELLAHKLGITLPKEEDNEFKKSNDKRLNAVKALSATTAFFKSNLDTSEGKIAKQYFYSRGFTNDTMESFKLGYSNDSWDSLYNHLRSQGFHEQDLLDAGLILEREKGQGYYDRFRARAMFPIFDFMGRVIGFGARFLGEDKSQAKYINSPQSIVYDKSKVLYGLHQAKNSIRSNNYAIMSEGYADVISLHQFGFTNAVASSGTALTTEQLDLLSRYTKTIYLAFDSDKAGQAATEKAIELALEKGFDVLIIIMPAGEDPDSLLREKGKTTFEIMLRQALNFVEYKLSVYKEKGVFATPAGEVKALREMLSLINKIPDRFQHDFYIAKIATARGIAEDKLKQLYEEKSKIETAQTNASIKKEIAKTELKIVEQKEEKKNIHNSFSNLRGDEFTIFKIGLRGWDEFNQLLENFAVGVDLMLSKEAKDLFSALCKIDQSTESLQNDIAMSQDIDDYEKNNLLGIALYEEGPMSSWEKYRGQFAEFDWQKVILNCIDRLEYEHLTQNISLLNQNIVNCTNDDELLKLMTQLKDLLLEQQALKDKIYEYNNEDERK